MEKSTLMEIKNTRVHSQEIHSKVLGPTVGFMGKLPPIFPGTGIFPVRFSDPRPKSINSCPKIRENSPFSQGALQGKSGISPNAKKKKSEESAVTWLIFFALLLAYWRGIFPSCQYPASRPHSATGAGFPHRWSD